MCVCVCVCVCMGAECKNASLSLAVRVVECNAGVLLVFFCAGLFWYHRGLVFFVARARDVNARVLKSHTMRTAWPWVGVFRRCSPIVVRDPPAHATARADVYKFVLALSHALSLCFSVCVCVCHSSHCFLRRITPPTHTSMQPLSSPTHPLPPPTGCVREEVYLHTL